MRSKRLTAKQLRYIKYLQNVIYWSLFTKDYIDPNNYFPELINWQNNKFIGHGPQDALDYCALLSKRAIEEAHYLAGAVGYPFSRHEANERLAEELKRHKRVFKIDKCNYVGEEFLEGELY